MISNTLSDILLSRKFPSEISFPDGIVPDKLLHEALNNKVLIRTVDILKTNNIIDKYPNIYLEESDKKKRILNIIGNHLCNIYEPHIFIKNFMHLPDIGDDIDLYLIDKNKSVDKELLKGINNRKVKLSWLNSLGGRTQYLLDDYNIELEIYHGKYGRIGEYNSKYGLFSKTNILDIYGCSLPVPVVEDQILFQIIQSLYCSGRIRLSEIIYLINKHLNSEINFDYLYKSSGKLNISDGCLFYFNYINKVLRKYFPDKPAIPEKYHKSCNETEKKQLNHKGIILRLNIFRLLRGFIRGEFFFSLKLLIIPVLFLAGKIKKLIGIKGK